MAVQRGQVEEAIAALTRGDGLKETNVSLNLNLPQRDVTHRQHQGALSLTPAPHHPHHLHLSHHTPSSLPPTAAPSYLSATHAPYPKPLAAKAGGPPVLFQQQQQQQEPSPTAAATSSPAPQSCVTSGGLGPNTTPSESRPPTATPSPVGTHKCGIGISFETSPHGGPKLNPQP